MASNVWRVYIKPFDDAGEYDEWIEVTDDVVPDSLPNIQQSLDNTTWDIGVYRNNSLNLKLNNNRGYYSDVGSAKTIFKYKRADSLVRIDWEVDPEDGPISGMMFAGECYLSEPKTLFTGLLSDESLAMEIEDDTLTFTVLGRESLLARMSVPGTLADNTDYADVIYDLLNQAPFNELVTVSAGNIQPATYGLMDDHTQLDGKTVKEALDPILVVTNSVLFIRDDVVYVGSRDIDDYSFLAVDYAQTTFYGQGSGNGAESIVSIKNIRNGLSRTFNYLTWRDSTTVIQDATSVSRYGVRKREFSESSLTTQAQIEDYLEAVLAEFKDPKQEFDLTVQLNYDTVDLGLLEKVIIDYPIVYVSDTDPLPICGAAICGEAVLPRGLWSFSVESDEYKIMGRTIDVASGLIKFKMRKV
jgi:hypothetical protein